MLISLYEDIGMETKEAMYISCDDCDCYTCQAEDDPWNSDNCFDPNCQG